MEPQAPKSLDCEVIIVVSIGILPCSAIFLLRVARQYLGSQKLFTSDYTCQNEQPEFDKLPKPKFQRACHAELIVGACSLQSFRR